MKNREEIDYEYAKKYVGRYILGKDLILPDILTSENPSGSTLISTQIGLENVILKFEPSDNETPIEDKNEFEEERMKFQPPVVYLDLKIAKKLQEVLNDLCDLRPLIIGEVRLYDADENESLLAVWTLSNEPQGELVQIRHLIHAATQPYAKILSYDYNIDGRWLSMDWNPGLKYKDRVPNR